MQIYPTLRVLACLMLPAVFLVSSVSQAAMATNARTVDLTVTSSAAGDGATYSYTFQNNSSQNIVAVTIGFDHRHEQFQLSSRPLGWSIENPSPVSSITSPRGWKGFVTTEEESPYSGLTWEADLPGDGIRPGQSLGGFIVKLPFPDELYRTGHFNVVSDKGTQLSLPIRTPRDPRSADTQPPSLAVSATPSRLWPPNSKLVPIKVEISASDNSGGYPEVKLVAITSNEGIETGSVGGAEIGTDDRLFSLRAARRGSSVEGRIYTITYSATDDAGNIALAQGRVVVPHDKRN